jgi:hypothetical protein|tara:strand:- start:533 stop:748 length:216 start_codon:yes stop_codon:yes gene_type:complete
MSEIGDDKDMYDAYEQEKEMAHSHAWDMTLAQAQDALTKRVRSHRQIQEIVDTLVYDMMNKANYWKDNENE